MIKWCLLLSIVTVLTPSVASAQEDEAFESDPPNMEYGAGSLASDPASIAKAPKYRNFRGFLPPSVDISRQLPKPGNQGPVGSCTAWAVGYAARAYYTKTFEGRAIDRPENLASPGYLYHLARSSAEPCSEGSAVSEVVSVLQRGAKSLRDYPYSRSDKCQAPAPAHVVASAVDFKVRGVVQLDADAFDDIKSKLASGHPVIISMYASKAFSRHRGSGNFRSNSRNDGEWHAMTLVGYDDARQAFRVINSWGRGWGDKGYAWIDYRTLGRLVRETYVLDVDGAPPKPTPVPPEPTPTPPKEAELPSFKCSKLTINAKIVSGYVSSETDLANLRSHASQKGLTVAGVRIAPWPQCETLLTLDKALAARNAPNVTVGDRTKFKKGDTLKLEIQTSADPSYAYVFMIQADGNVVTLEQPGLGLKTIPPNSRLRYGDGEEGRSKFVISPPFGNELVVAVTAQSPLLDEPFPKLQTDRAFLSAVRKALFYKVDPTLPERDVSAAVVDFQTEEK